MSSHARGPVARARAVPALQRKGKKYYRDAHMRGAINSSSVPLQMPTFGPMLTNDNVNPVALIVP